MGDTFPTSYAVSDRHLFEAVGVRYLSVMLLHKDKIVHVNIPLACYDVTCPTPPLGE